ncbi:MAG: histidine kinase [Eubacteriales bacterium]|nr:histidine kinase [Eubacteriales bacterium]
MAHTMRQIETQTSQVSDFVSWALNDDDILSLLERDEADANQYDMQYHTVISQLVDQLSYRPVSQYMRAMFLLGENGLDIRSGSEASLASEENISQLKHFAYDATYWGEHTINTMPFTLPGSVIPYCHPILNADGNQLGVLILLFSENVFQNCYDGLLLESTNTVKLYNGNGALVCGTEQTDAQQMIHLTNESYVTGWRIELSISEAELAQQNHMLFTTVLLLGCLMLIITMLVSWWLTRTLVAPINRMIVHVHRISEGQFQSVARREEKTELDYLENSILDMQDNILQLMEQERQREEDKQQLEIRVLQEQMNPHFLYHTLNTIRLMATMQGKQSIAKMTETLIQLLRANLSLRESEVSVAQELDFLESYMYIQNISQKGRLQWSYHEIQPELLQQKVPKLLLQPLAENAIAHGFANQPDTGIITLSGSRQGDTMIIHMQDNGSGMTPERLKAVQLSLRSPDISPEAQTEHAHGMALVNVQKRIWLHYGKQYGLTIDSKEHHGCRVTIRLPFHE